MLDKDGNRIKWRRRIKELRKRKGLTQQELAQELGVGFITVVRWEKKKGNSPSRLAMEKIKILEKERT